jgi:hypothetical protein
MSLADLEGGRDQSPKIDYEADAATYLEMIQAQIAPAGRLVPCDAAGKFSDDC